MKKDLKKDFQKQQKQQKLKNICKWVFVGIGWTTLLALFVGLVCVGAKGCSNKNKEIKNNVVVLNDNNMIYNKLDTDSNDIEYIYNFDKVAPMVYVDIDNYNQGSVGAVSDILYDVDRGTNLSSLITITDSTRTIDSVIYDMYVVKYYLGPQHSVSIQDDTTLLLSVGYVANATNSVIVLYNSHKSFRYVPNIALYNDFQSSINDDDELTSRNMWGLLLGVNSGNLNDGYSFEFNTDIKRNYIFNVENVLTVTIGANREGYYKVFEGSFSDGNGNYYSAIKMRYILIDGDYYINNVGRLIQADRTDVHYNCYYGMYFTDLNGNDILVNKVYMGSHNGQPLYKNGSYWLDVAYRQLTIYQSYVVYQNGAWYSGRDGLKNLYAINDSTLPDSGSGDATYSTFDLLKMVFESITSILKIEILPHITLGTFIFIPIVIMMVVFIVWLFKR